MPRFSPKIQRVTMLTRMTFNFSRHLLSVCGKMGFAGRRSAQIKLLSNIPMLVWIRSSTVLKISKAVPGLSRSAFKVFTRGILHLLSQETKGELRVIFSLEPHHFISAEPLTWNAYSTKCVRFAALLCSKCLKTRAVPEAMHKNRAGYTSDQAKKRSVPGERRTFWITSTGRERKGKEGKNSTWRSCSRASAEEDESPSGFGLGGKGSASTSKTPPPLAFSLPCCAQALRWPLALGSERDGGSAPAWEGQGRKAQPLQWACHSPACSLCHQRLSEDWHGALGKSDSLMFYVVT